MINVAILGFGTVGSGVADILTNSNKFIKDKANESINLKYILDVRDFPDSPYADKLIKDFSIIENDPELHIVVEVIGGAKIAYEFTKRALLAGKHVVTSNKELVATKGQELLTIAKDKNLNYLFEASVGGGIPIIRPLYQCLSANTVTEICGILNGTTNYILTEMFERGKDFAVALKDAQDLGYAELNPSADVDGHDACRKIAILSSLVYGVNVDSDLISTEGITKIEKQDVDFAEKAGMVIKLLGRARLLENGKLDIKVAPHLVSKEHQLSHVSDVFNGVCVTGDHVGDIMFYGKGAGKMPTASAVVADIIDVAKHMERRRWFFWEKAEKEVVENHMDCMVKYYIRINKANLLKAKEIFGDIKVIDGDNDSQMAFIINEGKKADILEKIAVNNLEVLAVINVL